MNSTLSTHAGDFECKIEIVITNKHENENLVTVSNVVNFRFKNKSSSFAFRGNLIEI